MTAHIKSEFLPSRLEFARRRRGLPRTKLAQQVDVASKTLQRWECGDVEPSPEQQDALARTLGVLPSFFHADEIDPLPDGSVSFRALSKMTAGERGSATAAGRLGVEFMQWLETRFKLPGNGVPILTGLDPETAADGVRAQWGLGTKPIAQLVPTLELYGIRVLSLAPDYRNVDAFSFYREGTPYVFLDTSKTAERLRFDAAHELGHLVLHGEHVHPQGREVESEANQFASAFLMPKDSILAANLYGATADQIIQAKRKWRVSAMALAHRLNGLELLSEWGYRSVCVELSKRGFRRSEPGSDMVRESSQLLGKVMNVLRNRGMSHKEIAKQLGLPQEELASYLFGLTVTTLPGESQGGGNRSGTALTLVRE